MRAAVSASKRCVCDACTAPKQNETPQIATKCWLRDETPKLLASCNSTNETKPPKLQQHMCGLQAHLGLVDQLQRDGEGALNGGRVRRFTGGKIDERKQPKNRRAKQQCQQQKSKATMPTRQAAAAGAHLIDYPLDPQNAFLLTRRQIAALHVRISRLLFLVFAASA